MRGGVPRLFLRGAGSATGGARRSGDARRGDGGGATLTIAPSPAPPGSRARPARSTRGRGGGRPAATATVPARGARPRCSPRSSARTGRQGRRRRRRRRGARAASRQRTPTARGSGEPLRSPPACSRLPPGEVAQQHFRPARKHAHPPRAFEGGQDVRDSPTRRAVGARPRPAEARRRSTGARCAWNGSSPRTVGQR